MKAYKVTGWVQYKNDAAMPINSTQLALSPESAIAQVKKRYHVGDPDYSFFVLAKAIKGSSKVK